MTSPWVLLVDEPSPKISHKHLNSHSLTSSDSHSHPSTPSSITPPQNEHYCTSNPNLTQLPETRYEPSFGSPFTPPQVPPCQPPSPPPFLLAPPARSITPPPLAPIQYHLPSGIPPPPCASAGIQYHVPTTSPTTCYHAAPQQSATWNTIPTYHHSYPMYAHANAHANYQYNTAPVQHDVYNPNSYCMYTAPYQPTGPPAGVPTTAPVPNYGMDERPDYTFSPSKELRQDIDCGRLAHGKVLKRMNTEVNLWARKQKKQAKAEMKNYGYDLDTRKSFSMNVKRSKIHFTLRNVVDRICGTPRVQ